MYTREYRSVGAWNVSFCAPEFACGLTKRQAKEAAPRNHWP